MTEEASEREDQTVVIPAKAGIQLRRYTGPRLSPG